MKKMIKKIQNKAIRFELPYWVSNGGDGSANVQFEPSSKIAEKNDEAQDEGWGEPSASTVLLKLENGELYYEGRDDNYRPIWIKIPRVK